LRPLSTIPSKAPEVFQGIASFKHVIKMNSPAYLCAYEMCRHLIQIVRGFFQTQLAMDKKGKRNFYNILGLYDFFRYIPGRPYGRSSRG